MNLSTIIRHKIYMLVLLFMLPVVQSTAAATEDDYKNPLGCRDTGYEFNLNSLELLAKSQGVTQSMYFLHNLSAHKLTLYQMKGEESSRGTYLNHQIGVGEWAVLSTTEPHMKFICTVPDSTRAYGKIVRCADNIHVCEYTNVKYGLNNKGNYWLVNSSTKNGAIREVVRYGIIPAV
ncbi:MAG: endopeptidase IV [Legionellaceae bacterium]|nr:endopeptidase IV [Legionellaceae bacterium]HCA89302.1 endopeptidase IV [Legionellales bacterium]